MYTGSDYYTNKPNLCSDNGEGLNKVGLLDVVICWFRQIPIKSRNIVVVSPALAVQHIDVTFNHPSVASQPASHQLSSRLIYHGTVKIFMAYYYCTIIYITPQAPFRLSYHLIDDPVLSPWPVGGC